MKAFSFNHRYVTTRADSHRTAAAFEAAAECIKVIKNTFVVFLGMQTEKVLNRMPADFLRLQKNLRAQRKTPDCVFSYLLCVGAMLDNH